MSIIPTIREIEKIIIPRRVRLEAAVKRLLGRRNVIFFRHTYYNFYYLAKALRKRGWSAFSAHDEVPGHPNYMHYHGEDINCAHPDPKLDELYRAAFYNWAYRNFDLIHFYGDGGMSVFPSFYGWVREYPPPDFVTWKKTGKKIGYTLCGCNSGLTPTEFNKWSAGGKSYGACDRCIKQTQPFRCNDQRTLSWIKQFSYADLICSEYLPAIGGCKHPQAVYNPLTMCLDPEVWSPDLHIPEEHRVYREDGELLVYHSVANYDDRTRPDLVNVKGSHAIAAAIERLRAEGLKVRLLFPKNESNLLVRYQQAQADIVIDQLNFGSCGATAREGLMLGKPVVCYLRDDFGEGDTAWKDEVPFIQSSEEDIYDTLKYYYGNRVELAEIGRKSRAFALKWLSADVCAERYEKVYDEMMAKDRQPKN